MIKVSKDALILGSWTFAISVFGACYKLDSFDLLIFIQIFIIFVSSFSLFSYPGIPFSLFKIYHIFNLFFFGIAPIFQYRENIEFIGEAHVSYNNRLISSIVILFSCVLFNVCYYHLMKKKDVFSKKNLFLNIVPIRYSYEFPTNILIFVSFCCFIIIFYYNNFNIFSLLIRGGEYADRLSVGKANSLIINKFIRPIPLIIFLSSVIYNPKGYFSNFILLLILLFTAFPLGMPRNDVAGFYIPVLLVSFSVFNRKNIFVSSLIIGLLLVFPFLNNFRRFTGEIKASFGFDFSMFNTLHFDAYASLTRIISNDIVTYGKQLLGVVFFFIPRSLWDGKPDGSGIYQAEYLNLNFSNISCPFIAEGYINFGFFGVFLFTFFLAFLTSKLDRWFWDGAFVNSFLKIPYFLILSMFLFVLRGDLMNGFSYTVGFLLSSYFIYKLLIVFRSIKKIN